MSTGFLRWSMRSCPLWILLIFDVIIFTRKGSATMADYKNDQNIGTVLFEKNEIGKRCWTNEELTLLNSRRMFQDLLPKVKVIKHDNDRYIALLMDYFHICLQNVRKLTVGKTKHLLLKALADTMGGYLQVYILPLTRHSYYTGNIKYRNAKRLFELHEELKLFLHTNGVGWCKPSTEVKHTGYIPPMVIVASRTPNACEGILTYSVPPTGSVGSRSHRHLPFKRRRKKRRWRKRTADSKSVNSDPNENIQKAIMVPLPFLDNEEQPNSIALPFKKDSLQSLYSEKASFVVVKFYVASVKCLTSCGNGDVRVFEKDLYNWLQQSVIPHLDDDKWYPAFGGVLRMIASMEENGLGGGKHHAPARGDGTIQIGDDNFYNGDEEGDLVVFGTTELVTIVVVSALLVWLLVGLTLVCYRFLKRHSEECSPCQSPNPPVAVLYKNKDYNPQLDTGPSVHMRKRCFGGLKNWWRNKFGPCPGGCQDLYPDEERCLAAMSYTSKDTIVSTTSKNAQRRKRATKSKSVSTTIYVSPGDHSSVRKVSTSSDVSSMTSEIISKPR